MIIVIVVAAVKHTAIKVMCTVVLRGQRRVRALSPKSAHHVAPTPSAAKRSTSRALERKRRRTLPTASL
jgi:hypothetical protein